MVRGPGEGLTVTVSLLGVYKTGGLDLPSPPSGTSLKFYVPCRQMPPMKKGKAHGSGVGAEHTEGVELSDLTRKMLSQGPDNSSSRSHPSPLQEPVIC